MLKILSAEKLSHFYIASYICFIIHRDALRQYRDDTNYNIQLLLCFLELLSLSLMHYDVYQPYKVVISGEINDT